MHELPVNKRKLNKLIREAKHFNIFPIFLPDYYYGENDHPISPLLIDLVNETAELLQAATKPEIDSLIESLPPGIGMMVERDSKREHHEFIKRLSLYYIVAQVHRDYFRFTDIIKENIQESIVLMRFPELETYFDKDGLLQINGEFILHEGGIEYKDHILHYHQLLRRGYTSNPNYDFLGRLMAYYNKSKPVNTLRIAIDHRRLMPVEQYCSVFEFDTWYGPPFDPKKLDDPEYIGLTVVKRNKDSLFELTNHLDRTEFFWSHKDGIKTLEIEELSDIDHKFENYIFNKYVHSERNTVNQITKHLDGAVKVYLEPDYPKRFQTQMPNHFKCHKKIKLWRMDGDIDLDNWIDLISFFYKSNEMIIEYFNPDAFEEMFELRVRDFRKWKSEQASQ